LFRYKCILRKETRPKNIFRSCLHVLYNLVGANIRSLAHALISEHKWPCWQPIMTCWNKQNFTSETVLYHLRFWNTRCWDTSLITFWPHFWSHTHSTVNNTAWRIAQKARSQLGQNQCILIAKFQRMSLYSVKSTGIEKPPKTRIFTYKHLRLCAPIRYTSIMNHELIII
jgi:hypothetical protein